MSDSHFHSSEDEKRTRLSEFVKQKRIDRGNMTIEELSSVSGLAIGTIEDIENAYPPMPKPKTLRRLAKGLGVLFEELDAIRRGIPYKPGQTKSEKPPFAQFVFDRRKDLGISKEELSERAEVPLGTITSIEAGYSDVPKSETLVKLAKGLEMPYLELDCIARGEEYSPKSNKYELFRDLESHIRKDVPADVAEALVETIKAVRKVVKKYD